MNLTGRYDFKGFQKLSGVALFALLSTNPTFGWMTRGIGGKLVFGILNLFTNFFMNKLLAGMNTLAVKLDTEIKRENFEQAFEFSIGAADTEKAIAPLTPEREKEIDDVVREAARKFLRLTKPIVSK
jgi:hypothetical protein